MRLSESCTLLWRLGVAWVWDHRGGKTSSNEAWVRA